MVTPSYIYIYQYNICKKIEIIYILDTEYILVKHIDNSSNI